MNLPDTHYIENEINQTIKNANQITVTNESEKEITLEFIKSIILLKKKIIETFEDPKKKAFEAHKSITAAEKRHKEPLDKAEKILREKVMIYVNEENRKARAEAERLAEIERKKEEERRLQEAEKLESQGKNEEAEKLIESEIEPVILKPVSTVEKTEGVSYRDCWNYEITNPDLIPRQFLIIDEKKIRALVNALKNECKIDGVRVFSTKTMMVR